MLFTEHVFSHLRSRLKTAPSSVPLTVLHPCLLPVHGTNPPAIDAWPPPCQFLSVPPATIFPASSILFSLRTESLIPSDFLEYTTENDTSFKASMKSDIFAMTGQSLPVLQKLMSSYTSILEIALEYASDHQNTDYCFLTYG